MNLAAAIVAAGLSGCSSLYGEKLGAYTDPHTNKPVAVTANGLPYTLVKPQFQLSTAPAVTAGSQNTVTVTLAMIPDTSQRYAVALDPGFLTNPDFKISFTSYGAVKTASATITDEITPTIKAIGSFVVSLATLGVVHPADKSPTAQRDALTSDIEANRGNGACAKPWSFYLAQGAATRQDLNRQWSVRLSTADAMALRLSAYKTDDDLKASFHYLTPEEKDCLQLIADSDVTAQAAYDKARTDFVAKGGASDLIGTLDKQVKDGAVTAVANDATWKTNDETQQADQRKLIAAAKAAVAHAGEGGLAQMAPADWRARHIAFTEDELARTAVLRLSVGGRASRLTGEIAQYREFLKEQRAAAAGAADLYARAKVLDAFLSRVREKSVRGGQAPASAEYVQYRTEFDALNTGIESLRAMAIASLTPPAPKPPPFPTITNEPTCWMESAAFNGGDAAAVKRACNNATPTFVLVLEPQ